jgi:hypothetical protein
MRGGVRQAVRSDLLGIDIHHRHSLVLEERLDEASPEPAGNVAHLERRHGQPFIRGITAAMPALQRRTAKQQQPTPVNGTDDPADRGWPEPRVGIEHDRGVGGSEQVGGLVHRHASAAEVAGVAYLDRVTAIDSGGLEGGIRGVERPTVRSGEHQ